MYDDYQARKQVLLEARQLFASRKLLDGIPRISVKNFDYCAITEVGMVAPLAPFPVYMCY